MKIKTLHMKIQVVQFIQILTVIRIVDVENKGDL
jgi:hypothetical protein